MTTRCTNHGCGDDDLQGGASHVTRHTSHVTRYTSHVTRYTSRVTRHTSHVTRHTSHVTCDARHPHHFTSHPRRTRPPQKQHPFLQQTKPKYGCGLLLEGPQQQRRIRSTQLVFVKQDWYGQRHLRDDFRTDFLYAKMYSTCRPSQAAEHVIMPAASA